MIFLSYFSIEVRLCLSDVEDGSGFDKKKRFLYHETRVVIGELPSGNSGHSPSIFARTKNLSYSGEAVPLDDVGHNCLLLDYYGKPTIC